MKHYRNINQSTSAPLSRNRAEQIGYYRFLMQSLMGETPKTALHRFLENENVTVSELVQSIAQHCQQNLEERHVLARA